MLNDQLSVCTNRREAIALFNMLRGRDPRTPWPLLPIFELMAPGGGGKSGEVTAEARACSAGRLAERRRGGRQRALPLWMPLRMFSNSIS